MDSRRQPVVLAVKSFRGCRAATNLRYSCGATVDREKWIPSTLPFIWHYNVVKLQCGSCVRNNGTD